MTNLLKTEWFHSWNGIALTESRKNTRNFPWDILLIPIRPHGARGFLKNIHSVYYIKRFKKDKVVIKDMCDSKKITVSMNRSNLIFHKSDVFEARLIPYKEEYFFSGSFCFHPNQLYRKIKKILKKISNNQTEKIEFLFLLSSMSLKLERSRNINYKDIYKI